MNSLDQISFRKMNGIGNDFVVLDARTRPISMTEAGARAIADRETGIGCDQVIVMARSSNCDVRMRIWNSAGAEVESCGNAARCIAELVLTETGKNTVTIETLGGLLSGTRGPDELISIDMGIPHFEWDKIPLSEKFFDTRTIELQAGPIDNPVIHSPSVVNVGNPHCIFWVRNDVESYGLEKIGPMLEQHMLFPEGANISLARIAADNLIILKVWERGAGLTRACGTGACAAAVCAARKKLTGRVVTVSLPGGDLDINWRSDDHIIMSGPVSDDYCAVLPDGLMGAE